MAGGGVSMRWVGVVCMCLLVLGCEERAAPVADNAASERRAPEISTSSNRLRNASFEAESAAPWFDFSDRNPSQWGAFTIEQTHAREGRRAALLELDSEGVQGAVRVLGVVQEITGPCPAYVSGWYFVERWERGCERQYLQVVAIASGGWTPPGVSNYQVARTLAGVESPPLRMKNRRFEVGGPSEPELGRWVFFEVDLASMFERRWGRAPGEDAHIRLFFEARYDGRTPGDPRAVARVWFDDLYAGPESRSGSAAGSGSGSGAGSGAGASP